MLFIGLWKKYVIYNGEDKGAINGVEILNYKSFFLKKTTFLIQLTSFPIKTTIIIECNSTSYTLLLY